MRWFRMFNESRNDRKLDTLADDEFRVWHKLLCLASDADERGVTGVTWRDERDGCDGCDSALEVLAIEVARGDVALLMRTLRSLIHLRILGEDDHGLLYFLNFKKRQYDKPSDTPEATRERKARQRERERSASPDGASRDVTPRHATEQNRSEENRVDVNPPLTPPLPRRGGEPPPPAADGLVLPSRGSGSPGVKPPEPPPRLPNAVPKPSREPPPDLVAAFDRFWRDWPKKVGRAEALAAFAQLRPTDDDVGRMVDAIPVQSAALDWPRERYRYCPKPATWLSERRWLDEMPEDRPGADQDRQYGGLSPPSSQVSDETLAWLRRKRPEAYEERRE